MKEFGNFELYRIETGDFKLDGGAMFGVVPKTLWSKGIPADEKNRIQMTMRCLLIRSKKTGKVYLIDTGAGSKFNEKMQDIYQLDYSKKNLHQSLKAHGFSAEDITDMVFTHLHFDHCGGSSYYDDKGELQLTFPNAVHHINEKHWENANHPNAREKASFLPENINPLEKVKLNLLNDNHEFEPGFSTFTVNGHSIGQQLPVITDGKRKLVFAGDLIPTHVHVPLPWVMGYDMYPVQTLDEKEEFLKQAASNKDFIFLEHDYYKEIIQIEQDGKKFRVSETLSLQDL